MRRLALLQGLLIACSDSAGTSVQDGGRFEIPDSGVIVDASFSPPDAEPPDSGPFVCDPACTGDQVCGCLDEIPRQCGCNSPQGRGEFCDPQVAETCADGFSCVIAVRFDLVRYVCSDGTDGIPCKPEESICTTRLGCVCQSTPLGRSCACLGDPPDNGLCDPNVPATCPDGVCIPIQAGGQVAYVCSDGMAGSACDPNQDHCVTSLGCTCPLFRGTEVCQCSEPGAPGDLCDPAVDGSCANNAACRPYQEGDTANSISTRCAGGGGSPDAGNPVMCDPVAMNCPPGQQCIETAPDFWMCI